MKRLWVSPTDDIAGMTLGLLSKTARQVRVAMFAFTDPELAASLVGLQARGVDVAVVADTSQARGAAMRAALADLASGNVRVRLTAAPNGSLMHAKFAVIDEWTWAGSYNWTRAARGEVNHVVVERNLVLADQYGAVWQQLWDMAPKYGPHGRRDGLRTAPGVEVEE